MAEMRVQQQEEVEQQDKLKASENGFKKPVKPKLPAVKSKKVTPPSDEDFIPPPPPKSRKYSLGKKTKSNLSVSDRDA